MDYVRVSKLRTAAASNQILYPLRHPKRIYIPQRTTAIRIHHFALLSTLTLLFRPALNPAIFCTSFSTSIPANASPVMLFTFRKMSGLGE